MVNKVHKLRCKQKRQHESRKMREQSLLLNAKKETLRKLESEGCLPLWIKAQKLS